MSDIITTAEAKTYLGVSVADDDAVIAAFILAAQEAMENFCSRNLVSTSVTEQLDGNGRQKLFLREPAQSVTSAYIDANRAFGSETAVSASDMYLNVGRDAAGRIVDYLDNIWTLGQKNIRITYLAGYTAATMPKDIVQACRVQVARMYSEWQRAKKGKDHLANESVDGWSQQWLEKEGLDPAAAKLLEAYVNYGV